MLTSNEYRALKSLIDGTASFDDLDSSVASSLIEKGFVSARSYSVHFGTPSAIEPDVSHVAIEETDWDISEEGREALQQFDQVSKKAAEEEKEKRFQHKLAIWNLIIPIITFCLGIIVEHFGSILGFLLSLF